MATPFDTMLQDPASFFLSVLIIFFCIFLVVGLALVFLLPDIPTPKEGGAKEKRRGTK